VRADADLVHTPGQVLVLGHQVFEIGHFALAVPVDAVAVVELGWLARGDRRGLFGQLLRRARDRLPLDLDVLGLAPLDEGVPDSLVGDVVPVGREPDVEAAGALRRRLRGWGGRGGGRGSRGRGRWAGWLCGRLGWLLGAARCARGDHETDGPGVAGQEL